MIATLVVFFLVTKRVSGKRQTTLAEQLRLDVEANTIISESFQNYLNLKIFSSKKLQMSKYAYSVRNRIDVGGVNGQYLANLNVTQRIVIMTGTLINLLICLNEVALGHLSPGSIILLNNIMIQTFAPLANLGTIYLRWQESFVEINDLLKIDEIQSKIVQKENAQELKILTGKIEFFDVNFSFSNVISV